MGEAAGTVMESECTVVVGLQWTERRFVNWCTVEASLVGGSEVQPAMRDTR
jgi:hypothetical protein